MTFFNQFPHDLPRRSPSLPILDRRAGRRGGASGAAHHWWSHPMQLRCGKISIWSFLQASLGMTEFVIASAFQ